VARHVVVAFPLGDEAVAVLSGRLGDGFAVRDIRADGPPADIVLAPPCSPQAIAHLKDQFPGSAVVIVELEDLLRGVSLGGPVSRSLAAGADAYYVAPSTEALGAFLAALPIGEGPQPVALPATAAADDLVERVAEASANELRRERVNRSDPAPGP
jgi:hypothetical protein